jgi:hypothetical protein
MVPVCDTATERCPHQRMAVLLFQWHRREIDVFSSELLKSVWWTLSVIPYTHLFSAGGYTIPVDAISVCQRPRPLIADQRPRFRTNPSHAFTHVTPTSQCKEIINDFAV